MIMIKGVNLMGILVAVKNFIEVRWIRKFRNREDIENIKINDKEQLEFMKIILVL